MDKQNYTLRDIKIQEVKKQFREIQNFIEKEFEKYRLIKRKRVIKSYKILLRAAYLYIIERLSFQRISDKMSCLYDVTMSDTAWKKQLAKAAPVFESAAMQCLNRKSADISNPKSVLGYSNTYALDATVIPAEGKSGTVFRLHTQYSLSENIATKIHITDCHSAESVKHYDVIPRTLYLADRAYGKVSQFAYIIDKQADFIFRFSPNGVRLFYDETCKDRINFNSLLGRGKRIRSVLFQVWDKCLPNACGCRSHPRGKARFDRKETSPQGVKEATPALRQLHPIFKMGFACDIHLPSCFRHGHSQHLPF